MLTKNLTPFLFGTKLTSLSPPQPQMTLVVRASYAVKPGQPLTVIESPLDQGPLSADRFEGDDAERSGACVYASDFADFKLNAEVLFGGRPMAECPVKFSVGAWSKTLVVVGRRVWTEKLIGAATSEPHPFTSMPIGYAQAFGGPGHAPNPAGKGRDTPELPNVEYPGSRARAKGDRPEPASFAPLNPAWPQRAAKVGRDYGRSWKKERAPFYSVDFDWTYFQSAPADQQLKGYLRGDEEVSLVNLHPAAANVSVRLPGLRVRVFVKDDSGVVREPPMKLDTLLAELESEKLVLTWRGVVNVREDDFSDVKTVFIASEPLAAAPLSEEHYRALIAEFEADPLEFDKRMPGARQALENLKAAAADDEAHPERTERERSIAMLGHLDASAVPEAQKDVFLSAIAGARASLDTAPALPALPEAAPKRQSVAELVEKAKGLLKQLRGVAAKEKVPLGDIDALEKLLDDPKTKQAMASAEAVKPEEIGPGKDLSSRNMANMDLSGRDLSGADLTDAILMGANLVGAKLVGANLKQAVLAKANLAQADLSRADLTRTNFSGAILDGANMNGAHVEQTLLNNAKLRGAVLTHAHGRMTVFTGADLSDAKLTGCDLLKALFETAALERADFSDAKLLQCTFSRCKAASAVFARAFVSNATFLQSELREASFADARGEGTSFMKTNLERAGFVLAVLPAAHFMEAVAEGARFAGADLRRSEFYRSRLDGAVFDEANLFGASFNKARLNGTRFVGANLYDSRFVGASGKGCDFNGANLTRAMLPS
jgi:uncharacterized protein YjbI with pentapeptide repeats